MLSRVSPARTVYGKVWLESGTRVAAVGAAGCGGRGTGAAGVPAGVATGAAGGGGTGAVGALDGVATGAAGGGGGKGYGVGAAGAGA